MKKHHRETWPRLESADHRTACHFCDTLHEVELITEGESAACRTCGQGLYANRPASLQRAVSFAVTGVFLMLLMELFPFMSLESQGNGVTMSINEAVAELWITDGRAVAVILAVFALILPAVQLASLLYICGPLLAGRVFPGAAVLARIVQTVQPWVMVEVFFLGTLVSLLKLVHLADISLGVGFWALVGLMFCLAGAIGGIDRLELWDRLEVAAAREKLKANANARA